MLSPSPLLLVFCISVEPRRIPVPCHATSAPLRPSIDITTNQYHGSPRPWPGRPRLEMRRFVRECDRHVKLLRLLWLASSGSRAGILDGQIWSREELPIHYPRNGPGGSADSSLVLLTSVVFMATSGPRASILILNQTEFQDWVILNGISLLCGRSKTGSTSARNPHQNQIRETNPREVGHPNMDSIHWSSDPIRVL